MLSESSDGGEFVLEYNCLTDERKNLETNKEKETFSSFSSVSFLMNSSVKQIKFNTEALPNINYLLTSCQDAKRAMTHLQQRKFIGMSESK